MMDLGLDLKEVGSALSPLDSAVLRASWEVLMHTV